MNEHRLSAQSSSQICPPAVLLTGNRDQLCRNAGKAQLICLFQCCIVAVRRIKQKAAIQTGMGLFVLSRKGFQNIIHNDDKSDGRCIFSKIGKQLIIASACYDGISDTLGIPLKDHTGIIIVLI